MSTGFLTPEAIEQAEDRIVEDVPTPEWGEGTFIRLRTPTSDELDEWECNHSNRQRNGQYIIKKGIRVSLVILLAINEDGSPMFGQQHAGMLGKKSGPVMDRLWAAAQRLAHRTNEDIDDLAKNSSNGQGSVSA